jgi:hypothetical protein
MYELPVFRGFPGLIVWFWLDDSPETFKNAPVALQLVGQCQEDEAVIAMTEIVDAALKAKQK